jgi:sulfite reductase (NADPH) hemoprotein beta-component
MPDTHFYRPTHFYQYDDYDRTLVSERVEQFRDQVRRRIAGELTEEQFKPLRLTNGLYLQLHAYMLRIAIPYGTLSSRQLRKLADISRKYDRGYGHFTTRQNLQLNWIKLEDAPDALAALAEVDMHAMQTSGNCIRNVTADHYAGAAIDEIEDPRIWCEIVRQWSTLHPEFSFLPRKFKIAITGSPNDRAAVRVHDIGLRLWANEAGEVGFEVIVGGGLGRTPMIGKTLREFLPRDELLAYLEATLRVYNRYGRRDNLYKARIKILVHEIGAEKMREEVEAEYAAIKDGALKLPAETIEAIARQFAPPALAHRSAVVAEVEGLKLEERDFALWLKSNEAPHRMAGYRIVTASLKPAGAPPGDASAVQMEGVADIADAYSQGEIRVSHEQNLILPHVAVEDLPAVWRALGRLGFAEANVGKITDIIACPGLDYCALANARSIPVAQRISNHFAELARQHDIGDLKIKISGCINACGHHHVGHIGILGVDKNGVELYQLSLGGDVDFGKTAIGTILGPAVTADKVVEAVDAMVATYLDNRGDGERFVDTYRRIGAQPFKERVYAAV